MRHGYSRSGAAFAGAALILLVAATRPVRAQDPLADARALYASARYDEALALLDKVRTNPSGAPLDVLTLEKYRALCLVALGRESDAESAFAGVVAVDPTYLPDSSEVSPRVRAFFREVRHRMLPGIARARFADAKDTYDRGAFTEAAPQFHTVVLILNDDDLEVDLADLKELAAGFEELSLSKAAGVLPSQPAAIPPPAPAAPPEPAATPPDERPAPKVLVYDAQSPGVTPPGVKVQIIPTPPAEFKLVGRTRGVYEVLIDEQGRVISVVVRQSLQPIYDHAFSDSTARWRYSPAYFDSRPVKYRKIIEVYVR